MNLKPTTGKRKVWAAIVVLLTLARIPSLVGGGPAYTLGALVGAVIGGVILYALPVAIGSGVAGYYRGWRSTGE